MPYNDCEGIGYNPVRAIYASCQSVGIIPVSIDLFPTLFEPPIFPWVLFDPRGPISQVCTKEKQSDTLQKKNLIHAIPSM